MKATFKSALAFTLGFEGGYVNHPKDPGGHTNKGITLTTLRRWKPDATVSDLKAIPDDLVEQIYRDDYWSKVSGDRLDAGVDAATFDYAVTSGPGAALKSLMTVIGGPAQETVKKLCARRLSIYQTFRHWKTFGKGWTRRVAAGEALWVKWALQAQIGSTLATRSRLDQEAATAKKKANQQTAGGVGAGGATAAPAGQGHLDQVAGWILAGAATAAILLAAFLLWRAHVNRQRAAAYADVAAEISE